MKNILVTGASGFIGCMLTQSLFKDGYQVRMVSHSKQSIVNNNFDNNRDIFIIDESKPDLGLIAAMSNVDTVIHLAARVHVLQETDPDPLSAFRKVNFELTKRLANLAVAMKVKRFIFISSLNLYVDGRFFYDHPLNEEDMPKPLSPYAISKWEAEQYLNGLAKRTPMEIVIIRPPLVYGPGVKANFLSLLKLTKLGLPLPVGLLNNKRSMISVNNLVDFIICCGENPNAANETFLISDNNDISTKELFTKLTGLFGKKLWLLPVPSRILYTLGTILGKKDIVDRLCSPLQVDITKAEKILNWQPIQTLDDGLREVVAWYKKEYL